MDMFYRRRKELRTFLLLGCAFVSFAAIIPFSHPDKDVYEHLDKVSEICSTMTFLVQITVIGRDINKKMRIKSLLWMTYISELLTLVDVVLACAEFVEAVVPGVDLALIDMFATAMEDVSLAFISVSRFFYIAMSKGVEALIRYQKLEMRLYFLFVTHEDPFMALQSWTNADWVPVQAMWNRFSLMLCILHTSREKIRSLAKWQQHQEAWRNTAREPTVSRASSKGPVPLRLLAVHHLSSSRPPRPLGR